MLEREIQFHSYDVDADGTVKISSIMHHMQQAAGDDLSQSGLTYKAMRDLGHVFVISKSRMIFSRLPDYEAPFTLRTIPILIHGATFIRDFYLERDGEIYMKASTAWALLDYEKRILLRPSVLTIDIPHDVSCSVGFEPTKTTLPRALSTTDPSEILDKRRVYRSMLDENRHLNNCLYSDLIFDYTSRIYKAPEIQISFMSEAREDDVILISRIVSDECEYFIGFNETHGRRCFEASVSESVKSVK
ncbi:MAG: hypothetical protein E7665_09565 [Ruminococcaceae bacterium]|nr:hypothetical protein [Oscillospiraceae bacterium]